MSCISCEGPLEKRPPQMLDFALSGVSFSVMA